MYPIDVCLINGVQGDSVEHTGKQELGLGLQLCRLETKFDKHIKSWLSYREHCYLTNSQTEV